VLEEQELLMSVPVGVRLLAFGVWWFDIDSLFLQYCHQFLQWMLLVRRISLIGHEAIWAMLGSTRLT
jgi:hypothetical protein